MSPFVISRCEFAGVVVTMATAAVPLASPEQSRRVVALGRISRRGGQVLVSDRIAGPNATPAVAGGGLHA